MGSMLPLSVIDESPLNPRRLFDPLKLEELAASMRKHGVIEPLVVRKRVTGRFELIAGARRFRAAGLAKLKTVPVVRRECTDEEAIQLMLVENLQRAELEPLDECETYHQLCDDRGYTQVQIGDMIGKTGAYVNTRMKLRDLSVESRKLLLDGQITVSHAIELARVPAMQQRAALKIKEPSSHGSRMTIGRLKRALRPMEQRTNAGGQTYDVQSRCWLCAGKLQFGTDGNGNTVTTCPTCLAEIRALRQEVAKLKRRVHQLEAEAA